MMSLLGTKPIEYEIEKRKLIFLGQLCSHSVDHYSRDIFYYRLLQFVNNPENQKGFFNDINRILRKYSLFSNIQTFVLSGNFPTKHVWKHMVKLKIQEVYTYENGAIFENNATLKDFRIIKPNSISVSRLWLISKTLRPYGSKCQQAIVLLNRLFYDTFTKRCQNCNTGIMNNIIHHGILECSQNELTRFHLWQKLYSIIGAVSFGQFILLSPRLQLLSLFSGLEEITNSDMIAEECLKAFISSTYLMKIAYVTPLK